MIQEESTNALFNPELNKFYIFIRDLKSQSVQMKFLQNRKFLIIGNGFMFLSKFCDLFFPVLFF